MADPIPSKTRPLPPLLNLDTLSQPLTVATIDGEPYPIRSADQLSLAGYHVCQRAGERLDVLWGQPVLSDDESAELSMLLDRVTRVVLDAPDAVHRRLTDLQRLAVAESFIRLPLPTLRSLGAAMTPRAAIPTGANISPNSSGSMAATPTAGTRRSRSRTSGRA
jgi:hypothetical protein